MSLQCTCRRALLRSALPPQTRIRSISSTSTLSSPSSSPTPPPPTSSCPPGTTFKNLNFLKDGQDPVALADEEYPSWLWALASGAKGKEGGKEEVGSKSMTQKLRKEGKKAIKAGNTLKG